MNTNNNSVLRVRNDHVSVALCGYAIDDGNIAVYLSMVGIKNACKAIWASVVNNPRKFIQIGEQQRAWGGDAKVNHFEQFWQDLPEQVSSHLVVAHKALFDVKGKGDQPVYLLATQHEASLIYDRIQLPEVHIPDAEIAQRYYQDVDLLADSQLVPRLALPSSAYAPLVMTHPEKGRIVALDIEAHWQLLRAQAVEQINQRERHQALIEMLILPRLIALLNKSLDIPLHPSWAKALWDAGMQKRLIVPCTRGGHVLAAYKVLTIAQAWQEIVCQGLAEQRLHMPQPTQEVIL